MIARLSLLSVALFALLFGVALASPQKEAKPSLPSGRSREEIDKLIGQLGSDKFKEREEATRRLMERDEALPALQRAAKSDNAEVVRRARKAIEAINKRLAKRALRRAAAMLKKGQTDQFVEQVVRWREYMDEDCWKAAVEHVEAIIAKATKASGEHLNLTRNVPRIKPALPWANIAKLQPIRAGHLKRADGFFIKRERILAESVTVPDGFVRESFVLCDGAVESKFTLAYSVVFANGNLKIGNPESLASIVGCIVICDGSVTATASVNDSIILCTGNVRIGAGIQNSIIASSGSVKEGLTFPGSADKNSVIQESQREPLHFLHFFDLAQVGIEVKSPREQVQVVRIARAKPFARAGIRTGDRVVAVGGMKVDSVEAFRRLFRQQMQESKPILLDIRREDQPLRVEVRVANDAP